MGDLFCYFVLLGKVDLAQSESRIIRIARGSGTHPEEVRNLLKLHKHFEKVFGKVGKNMKGEASKAKQLQVCSAIHLVIVVVNLVCVGVKYIVYISSNCRGLTCLLAPLDLNPSLTVMLPTHRKP